jgi:ABC-type sulfate transport system substrate-binding protein
MATIADFGGWTAANAQHFAAGGQFDRIYTRK